MRLGGEKNRGNTLNVDGLGVFPLRIRRERPAEPKPIPLWMKRPPDSHPRPPDRITAGMRRRESRNSARKRRANPSRSLLAKKTAVLLSRDSDFSEETPVSSPMRRSLSIPAGKSGSAMASVWREGRKSSFRKPWRNETASGSWLWRTASDLSCTQECET